MDESGDVGMPVATALRELDAEPPIVAISASDCGAFSVEIACERTIKGTHVRCGAMVDGRLWTGEFDGSICVRNPFTAEATPLTIPVFNFQMAAGAKADNFPWSMLQVLFALSASASFRDTKRPTRDTSCTVFRLTGRAACLGRLLQRNDPYL